MNNIVERMLGNRFILNKNIKAFIPPNKHTIIKKGTKIIIERKIPNNKILIYYDKRNPKSLSSIYTVTAEIREKDLI